MRFAETHKASCVVTPRGVPHNKCHRSINLVCEGQCARALVANRDVAVGPLGVGSLASHANTGHVLAVIAGEAKCEVITIKTALFYGRLPVSGALTSVSQDAICGLHLHKGLGWTDDGQQFRDDSRK